MIDQELQRRALPELFSNPDAAAIYNPAQWAHRRSEIKELLCREEYGQFPRPPRAVNAKILSADDHFCAGNVTLFHILLTLTMESGEFSFPFYIALPVSGQPCPAFLHINFRDAVPDKYMPTEEICDNGFAVVSFCYQDVTTDDNDFSNGLSGALGLHHGRGPADPGKIILWSWAAMRIMDYLQTFPAIDSKRIAVVGHSRLGKTALLTGAFDERFALAVSNNSGCGGAAVSRLKKGETIEAITHQFPYWFCPNYAAYANREALMPFDQHFLLALLAPRGLYVASAAEDLWADPISEYLGCCAASEAYQCLGQKGFVHPDHDPVPGDTFAVGVIGYHLRSGCHYFSRYDWLRFMEFFNLHF